MRQSDGTGPGVDPDTGSEYSDIDPDPGRGHPLTAPTPDSGYRWVTRSL